MKAPFDRLRLRYVEPSLSQRSGSLTVTNSRIATFAAEAFHRSGIQFSLAFFVSPMAHALKETFTRLCAF